MATASPLYVTIIHAGSISTGDVAGSTAALFMRPDNPVALERQQHHDEILSRRRRYLVFPQDSSLQLGGCILMKTNCNLSYLN